MKSNEARKSFTRSFNASRVAAAGSSALALALGVGLSGCSSASPELATVPETAQEAGLRYGPKGAPAGLSFYVPKHDVAKLDCGERYKTPEEVVQSEGSAIDVVTSEKGVYAAAPDQSMVVCAGLPAKNPVYRVLQTQ